MGKGMRGRKGGIRKRKREETRRKEEGKEGEEIILPFLTRVLTHGDIQQVLPGVHNAKAEECTTPRIGSRNIKIKIWWWWWWWGGGGGGGGGGLPRTQK